MGYNFPEDLYVNVREVVGQGVKAEIYRRIEKQEGEVVHMKRVGLVWLRGSEDEALLNLTQRLNDEISWDCFS